MNRSLTLNLSRLINNAKRLVQHNAPLQLSLSLQGPRGEPHRFLGELILRASVWLRPGITPCVKNFQTPWAISDRSIALIGRGQSRRRHTQTRGLDPPVRRANRNESHDRRDQRTAGHRV